MAQNLLPALPGSQGKKGSPLDTYLKRLASEGPSFNSSTLGGDGGGISGVSGTISLRPDTTPSTPAADSGDSTLNNLAPSESINYDPELAQIRAASEADYQTAENAALEGKRNVLLQFGDRSLASKILGESDPTIKAIAEDPLTGMSTLGKLLRNYGDTVKQNEAGLNTDRLFYSSARNNRLKQLATQNTENVSDAEGQVQKALAAIGNQLLDTKNQIRNRLFAAEQAAFLRAILAGLAGAKGSSSSDDPGSTDDGSTKGSEPPPVKQRPGPQNRGILWGAY